MLLTTNGIMRLAEAAKAVNINGRDYWLAVRDNTLGTLAKGADERNKEVFTAIKEASNLPEGDSPAYAYLRKCKSVILKAVDAGIAYAEYASRTELEKAIKADKQAKALAELTLDKEALDAVDGSAERAEQFREDVTSAHEKGFTAAELVAATRVLAHMSEGADFAQFYAACASDFDKIAGAVRGIRQAEKARKPDEQKTGTNG
jgi:hypothetical protein